jgi:hypothetical protein
MSRAPRRAFALSDSLNRRLNGYVLAASAAGVSVLALSTASAAKVVYTETNQVTHIGYPIYIDLNHDGITDFLLRTNFYFGSSGTDISLSAVGNANNRVAGGRFSRSSYFLSAAYALPAGARIGPKRNFSVPFPFLAMEIFSAPNSSDSDLGAWAGGRKGVKDRYLGFKFVIRGEVHYGWARLSVSLGHQRHFDDVSGALTGYAYETVAGKPIVAGQTTVPDVITVQSTTLGALALGRK